MDQANAITQLLGEMSGGNSAAGNVLLPLVYDELRRIARGRLRGEQAHHSLQPTALVHEAYLRLASIDNVHWQGRLHFYAMAATLMRRILVDHARERMAEKRGGDFILLPIDGLDVPGRAPSMELVALHQALERLEAMDARQARVVELRYFAGLTDEEIGELLEVSSRTIKRDWRVAKAFLYSQLAG